MEMDRVLNKNYTTMIYFQKLLYTNREIEEITSQGRERTK